MAERCHSLVAAAGGFSVPRVCLSRHERSLSVRELADEISGEAKYVWQSGFGGDVRGRRGQGAGSRRNRTNASAVQIHQFSRVMAGENW